jgi:hypothetical protein
LLMHSQSSAERHFFYNVLMKKCFLWLWNTHRW